MMLLLALCLLILPQCNGFRLHSGIKLQSLRVVSMEYIPDGLTKAQWEAMKKKEVEANKGKNLGAVGITKFQSRSFEAWQKSGGKNLFPVDPSKPITEKPYMQRPGGTPDGADLKKKGLQGKGQGTAVKLTEVDKKYSQLETQGQLKSTPFNLPWTNEAANKVTPAKPAPAAKSVASKAVTSKPSTLSKAASGKAAVEEPPKKKSFFGLF